MMRLMIPQQMHDLTGEQAVESGLEPAAASPQSL
jgi:hypothetical protein